MSDIQLDLCPECAQPKEDCGEHQVMDTRECIRIVFPDTQPAVLLEVVDTAEYRYEIWGAEWRRVAVSTEDEK